MTNEMAADGAPSTEPAGPPVSPPVGPPNPFDLRQAISDVEAGARGLLEAADYLIAIGGDHTIALPLLRATAARHGPVALVHFDAYLDTWDTYALRAGYGKASSS